MIFGPTGSSSPASPRSNACVYSCSARPRISIGSRNIFSFRVKRRWKVDLRGSLEVLRRQGSVSPLDTFLDSLQRSHPGLLPCTLFPAPIGPEANSIHFWELVSKSQSSREVGLAGEPGAEAASVCSGVVDERVSTVEVYRFCDVNRVGCGGLLPGLWQDP